MNSTAAKPFLNYLAISLWISSNELTPEDITRLVGLEPTHTHHRGALIPGRTMPRRSEFDVNEWQLRKQYDAKPGHYFGQYTENFITDFLKAITPHAGTIKKLSETHQVTLSFTYHLDHLPFIGLTRDQIQAISTIGAKVDYDLMIESDFNDANEIQPR